MKPRIGQAAGTFCVLVIAQAACLGLGLWLETQFAAAVTEPALVPSANSMGDGSSTAALRAMAFLWIVALQTVVAYLILSRVRTAASHKEHLAADELLRRQNDLVRTRDAIVFGLAKLAESRDPETGNHLERIARYSTLLAKALRRHPRYREEVSASFVKLIGISSALHDIGKVGVPDSVLLKQGKLNEEERLHIEKHPEIGGRCIRGIELRLGGSNFLQMARQIALAHHERWDGDGYPKGLAAESIPLAARIVAIADVYDALTVRRVYKEAYSHELSVAMIRDGAGSQFDPDLVDVFLKIHEEFHAFERRCRHLAQAGEKAGRKTKPLPRATNDPLLIPLPEAGQALEQMPTPESY